MSVDLLILNTAVVDFRSVVFDFAEHLAGKGGLARCQTADMPLYSQKQYSYWIERGWATAGGPGNTAPLTAKAGIRTAVGVHLGRGNQEGLDVNGKFFRDTLLSYNVDMSAIHIHPSLPTGVTFIYDKPCGDRGGITYFPNANNEFDFEYARNVVRRLSPGMVYYMYSGLSDKGDANNGRDLADFMRWCRSEGIITIADSHTLAGNPSQLIASGSEVIEYKLLEPLLPQLNIFFSSCDEARLIENTLGEKRSYRDRTEDDYILYFLEFLSSAFWNVDHSPRVFGVTVKDGAFVIYRNAEGGITGPRKVTSKFMVGDVKDLVGAGDSFRAGVASYIAKNLDTFKQGEIDIVSAVQMGNLFASLYIKASLNDRYGTIGPYKNMLRVVENGLGFESFEELVSAVLG